MVDLSLLVWIAAVFFAYVGFSRGWSKEIISMSGIILGLFALREFDGVLRGMLFANLPPEQTFLLQSVLFIIIVFISYETRALIAGEVERARRSERQGRDSMQTGVLGAIVGFGNGYLIAGSLWYFLDINKIGVVYPLDPYVVAPVGEAGAAAVQSLPLNMLTAQGAGGDLLSLAVIVLFLVVLLVI